jgi:hypothetical protein
MNILALKVPSAFEQTRAAARGLRMTDLRHSRDSFAQTGVNSCALLRFCIVCANDYPPAVNRRAFRNA